MVEGDDIDFERQAGDFLGFDPLHLAHAMGRIDDVIANREIVTALAHRNVLSNVVRATDAGTADVSVRDKRQSRALREEVAAASIRFDGI